MAVPTITSAVILSNGQGLGITFSENVGDVRYLDVLSGFGVNLNGTNYRTFISPGVADPNAIYITVNIVGITIREGQTVTFDYDDGAGLVSESTSDPLANVSGGAVTNNSTVGGTDGIGDELAWWCPSLDSSGNGTGTVNDLAGNGNDATLLNMSPEASRWVADTTSGGVRAIDFDGGMQHASAEDSGLLLSGKSAATISLWVMPQGSIVFNRGIAGVWGITKLR